MFATYIKILKTLVKYNGVRGFHDGDFVAVDVRLQEGGKCAQILNTIQRSRISAMLFFWSQVTLWR
jgi:hypothetical protein